MDDEKIVVPVDEVQSHQDADKSAMPKGTTKQHPTQENGLSYPGQGVWKSKKPRFAALRHPWACPIPLSKALSPSFSPW